jgi:hypothetical protein
VRENLDGYEKDPGWYQPPPGTLATNADPDDMKRDLGLVPEGKPPKSPSAQQHHHG